MPSLASYTDPSVFEAEKNGIFKESPRYIGHEKLVPNPGDFYVLGHENDGRVLVRDMDGNIRLISNVCRHRQATMLSGTGNTRTIVCPIHKWAYDTSGTLKATPQMHHDSSCGSNTCKKNIGLREWKLQNWRGLLFVSDTDIAEDLKDVGYADEINFSDYRYYRTDHHECQYNWKTFMEIYGDDYHIVPSHPGLSKMLDCESLHWEFSEKWHIQSLRPSEKHDTKTTSIYEKWRTECLEAGSGEFPKYGAIWFAYYPNLMIEVYPHLMTVSVLYPISAEKTLNVVQFFRHKDVDESFAKVGGDAYIETVIEDDDFGVRMDRGRKALLDLGMDESGPYHDPLENGTKHFHEWYDNIFITQS